MKILSPTKAVGSQYCCPPPHPCEHELQRWDSLGQVRDLFSCYVEISSLINQIGALEFLCPLSSSRVWVPTVGLFHNPEKVKSRSGGFVQEFSHPMLCRDSGIVHSQAE